MNKTVLTVLGIIVIVLLGFALFGGDAEAPTSEEEATSEKATEEREDLSGDATYQVDTEESQALWEAGKKIVVDYRDSGTIDMKEGTVVVEDGQVSSATVVFDMTSITSVDTQNESMSLDRLTTHLKSDDFFAVATYPEATLEVTDVVEADGSFTVSGDLTIRGITEPITFPADIFSVDGSLVVDADVTVDRALYDVRFGSDSFFDNLGDNVIDDEFIVQIRLVATPVEA